ncbi:hypothetical protein D3C78_1863860 [compost metagenome]
MLRRWTLFLAGPQAFLWFSRLLIGLRAEKLIMEHLVPRLRPVREMRRALGQRQLRSMLKKMKK